MANVLKQAVFNLIEKAFNKGYVVATRSWKPATIHEIDIHMPGIDMNKWNSIYRIKCKVGEFEYRDYTPATWDIEKKVCTVIIETEHKGCGSSWAKNLQVGDTVLFGPVHAAQLPAKPGKVIGFGDGSALGHFLALKHLTDRKEYPLEVVIFLNEVYTLPDHFIAENPEFEFIMMPDANSLEALHRFSDKKTLSDYTSVYIAGYIPMVSGLRKVFKKNPDINAKIYAHGFWS